MFKTESENFYEMLLFYESLFQYTEIGNLLILYVNYKNAETQKSPEDFFTLK